MGQLIAVQVVAAYEFSYRAHSNAQSRSGVHTYCSHSAESQCFLGEPGLVQACQKRGCVVVVEKAQ